jgi:hypothetical protein
MVRTTFVLLITLYALVAGMLGSDFQTVSSTTPHPTVLQSIPIKMETSTFRSSSLYYQYKQIDLKSINKIVTTIPIRSNKLSINVLFDFDMQPYWLGPNRAQSQSLTLIRGSSETRFNTAKINRIASFQFKHNEIQTVTLCSSDLLESSPPGFFLLI